jgi:hypothetical protein
MSLTLRIRGLYHREYRAVRVQPTNSSVNSAVLRPRIQRQSRLPAGEKKVNLGENLGIK